MEAMGVGEEDAALVSAWRRGSPEAARRAVFLHGPAMLRVALALCRRPEDAEDVVQDALLRAHRTLASFDPRRGNLRAWLVGIAANRARQVRRGAARYLGLLGRLRREPYTIAEAAPPPARDLALARERLASLTPREREAFVLVAVEDLDSSEAARVMEISASTVRVLVARARTRLERQAAASPAGSWRAEGREP